MNAGLRILKTEAEQKLAESFAGAQARLPGAGGVVALREQAFRRFEAQGLPHRRVEEWKYTDLRALMKTALPLATPPDATAKARAANAGALFKDVAARRLVFVDGAFAPDLSDLTPEPGLAINNMASALGRSEPMVAAHLGQTFETKDVAVALNTALMGDGALIHVAPGATLARPIHLVFVGAQSASVYLRSLLIVGAGASVTLLESHDYDGAQVNTALDIVAGDNSVIDHIKAAQGGSLHLSSVLASVGAGATFNTFAFTVASPLVRNQLFVRFDGEGTTSNIGGASLLRGKEHVDNTLVIDHAKSGCTSRERFRAVLDEAARGVFQGKITVRQQAQQTDAKMASNALLLSDDAEASSKPELEIFADDVQCGHGATVGALQEDLLFYLRARGIPRREAEALLVQSFIGETIETVNHEGVRDALLGAAIAWLEQRR